MSLERKSFCGACCKSKEKLIKESRNEELELKNCTRCRSIKYCGRSCQRSEFKNHNDDCQIIKTTTDDLTKIEESFRKFKFSAACTPQDILRTKVGDFWEFADTEFWDEKVAKSEAQKSKVQMGKIWPREYLIKRMELVTALWRVADTNLGNFETTEIVLEHLLAMLRLDISDGLNCREKIAFMFLILGRDDDAYNFVKYWLKNTFPPQNYKSLEEGQWLHEPDQDKYEDLFIKVEEAEFANKGKEEVLGNTFLGLKLALLAIKIRNVIELEESDLKVLKFDKRLADARPQSTTAKLRDCPLIVDCAHLFLRGEPKAHEMKLQGQYNQIKKYLELINESNETILPALVDPKPLQSSEDTPGQSSGGVNEAKEMLKYSWRYFHRLSTPAQGITKQITAKKIIAKFLYPDHAVNDSNRPYPAYDCVEKTKDIF